jgi:hypothetical protein
VDLRHVVNRRKASHVTKIFRYLLPSKDSDRTHVTLSDEEPIRDANANAHYWQATRDFYETRLDEHVVDTVIGHMSLRDKAVLGHTAECLHTMGSSGTLSIKNFFYSCREGTVAVETLLKVIQHLRSRRFVVQPADLLGLVVRTPAAVHG